MAVPSEKGVDRKGIEGIYNKSHTALAPQLLVQKGSEGPDGLEILRQVAPVGTTSIIVAVVKSEPVSFVTVKV